MSKVIKKFVNFRAAFPIAVHTLDTYMDFTLKNIIKVYSRKINLIILTMTATEFPFDNQIMKF